MKHSILINLEYPLPESISETLLLEAAYQTLASEDLADSHELTLVLADDDHLQQLNADFRGIDAPTDILSFEADPLPPEVQGDDPFYLGDILISIPYAARRAASEGHPLADELRLLVIHGTLHLLGYDHDTPENQAEMWAQQRHVLSLLHIQLDVPDYLHDA